MEDEKIEYNIIILFKPFIIAITCFFVQCGVLESFNKKIINNYFYNSNLPSVESMLYAMLYERIGDFLISVVMTMCGAFFFMPALIKMIRTKHLYIPERQKFYLILVSIFFLLLPLRIVCDYTNFEHVKGIYSDLREVKTGNLTTSQGFYHSSFDTNGSPIFTSLSEYSYNRLLFASYSEETYANTKSYFIAWRSELDAKFENDYIFNAEAEVNNQIATMYELTHTSNYNIIVDYRIIEKI